MRTRFSYVLLIIGPALLMFASGCDDPRPEETRPVDTIAAVDSVPVAGKPLPSGRFQVPTRHTPVPDMYITLPSGYTIHDMSRMPDDQFFIIHSSDPSMRDSTAITPGFLRVYIGVNAQAGLEPGRRHTEQNVVIAGVPLTWKLWTELLPDKSTYYLREITSSDFFASLSPELAKAPLHLHLYISGADSSRVSDLMKAAQTLSPFP